MATGFLSKIFKPQGNITIEKASLDARYPWLEPHDKYGQGFLICQANVDDGYGYGCMPDILPQLGLDTAIVTQVRQRYSWLTILDRCIETYGHAEKKPIEQFSDCTGFSDVCWWIHIPEPTIWLSDMKAIISVLQNE